MKREIVKNNGIAETVISRFEDVHEFVAYALGGYENERLSKLNWRGAVKRDRILDEWYTGKNGSTAADVAAAVLDPSPDYNQLNIEPPGDCGISRRCNVRRVRRGLDCGDDIDVERWAARDLQCFENVERVRAGRPSVRVVVDFFAAARQNHDYFVNFSSLVAAVIEMAENANINISVDICFAGRMNHRSHTYHYVNNVVTLKRENEMLDKNLLLYVCGGHAFYRTLSLQAEMRASSEIWNLKIGNGGSYCATADKSVIRGSFVVSARDTDNAGDVLRKFHNFIEQGETATAAAC